MAIAGLGDIYKNHALDAIFGNGFNPPTNFYIGLNIAAGATPTGPISSDGHTTEVTVADYVRASMATDGVRYFGPAASGSTGNTQSVTFNKTTLGWGTITDFTIWDHPTSTALANYVGFGHLTSSHTVAVGETAQFDAADLTVTAV